MLAHISRTLKDSGRLAIIDFYRPDKLRSDLPPPWHIRLDRDDAIHEIESHGFGCQALRITWVASNTLPIFTYNKSSGTAPALP